MNVPTALAVPDGDPIRAGAAELLALAGARNCSIATAESLTGGLVSDAFVGVPGASAVFRGGVVAYSTDVKAAVLGVPEALLAEHGPVAAATAEAMARAACRLFGAGIGLATTGVAGPEPVGRIPPGVVFVAAALRDGTALVRQADCLGDRAAIRRCATLHAIAAGVALLRTGKTTGE